MIKDLEVGRKELSSLVYFRMKGISMRKHLRIQGVMRHCFSLVRDARSCLIMRNILGRTFLPTRICWSILIIMGPFRIIDSPYIIRMLMSNMPKIWIWIRLNVLDWLLKITSRLSILTSMIIKEKVLMIKLLGKLKERKVPLLKSSHQNRHYILSHSWFGRFKCQQVLWLRAMSSIKGLSWQKKCRRIMEKIWKWITVSSNDLEITISTKITQVVRWLIRGLKRPWIRRRARRITISSILQKKLTKEVAVFNHKYHTLICQVQYQIKLRTL